MSSGSVVWIRFPRSVILSLLLAFAVFALSPETARALQNVNLRWQPSAGAGVVGYSVYYGTQSGVYPQMIMLGNATTATIHGLQEGVTYYFVVKAYDIDANESAPSNEAVYTVPPASAVLNMRPIQAPGFPLAFNLTTTGAAPPAWALEATTNFLTWNPVIVGTNSSPAVTVLISTTPWQMFRLRSSTPGVALAGLHVPAHGVPNAMYITTQGDPPPQWTLETSRDAWHWTPVTSGSNVPLNVVVFIAKPPWMFFRLKSR